ncbi:MAG: CHASE3 domain-containing protein [Acidobacteriota bacterium]|nr:CHASE3 domain-containing protein [Acidobacteriota bacterium]
MPSWKRIEIFSLLLATCILIVTGLSALDDWNAFRTNRAAVNRSREILQAANSLQSAFKDAETGQRGYLLTQNPRYLEPYRKAAVEIPGYFSNLKRSIGLDPVWQADLKLLDSAIPNKLAELNQTIETRNRASLQAAIGLVMTDRGQRHMEVIRAVTDRMIATEYWVIAQRSSVAEDRVNRSWMIDALANVVLLALLVLSAVTIHRNSKKREELIALLQDDEQRLRDLGQKASDSEERMRNILESIADGFVSFDRDFRITYVNAAAERIFASPKGELLGKDFLSEFPDEAVREIEQRYRQVIADRIPLTFELFSPNRDSWWEESIYPATHGGLSVYFRDVTERKRLEERGRHTQKLESLGVLAGGIAHDFNNLLTAILGGASLLQDELPADSPSLEHVRIVLSASERAAQLTRQMLAYSGRGRFVVEQLDLSQQVREITALLESSVTRDVELLLSLETQGILVEADCGQIQQLVMNLVLNGAEAIEGHGGTVVVSTRLQDLDADYVRDNMAGDNVVPGTYILLEVHDTGKGMDAETLSRIFDPFFTTKFTGRGLGLAAVIGIVRGHRGAIKVYSHVGQGTTFKVFFPVAAQQKLSRLAEASPKDLQGHETVLIVDDEEVVQRMALATLEKYGYRVLQARNGKEAVDIFEKDSSAISLVLLDMTMPVMSGEETLHRLSAIRPDVLVIASSGYNEVEALRRFGRGVRGFLQKPYRAAQLAEKVKASLSLRDSAVR